MFIRTGPALKYPIKWVYQRPHMPIEIIGEFDTWRQALPITLLDVTKPHDA